ncbi:hypothetical protein BGX29_010723 [Mortierella sp. GBA35]|nr:hypothetical protein BGX29_010723 [Mortierella sp. GBA35]
MEAAQELYRFFLNAERAWMQGQSITATTAALEECSLHYGEFAFLLAGLKPCLLLQLPNPAMTQTFYHQVLSSQLMHHPSYQTLSRSQGLECHLITRDIRSSEMSLQGYVLLWCSSTVDSHPRQVAIQRSINLLCPPSPSKEGKEGPVMISEQDLAIMLDIPGRLPSTENEIRAMIEVSYWHDHADPDESPVLLTAFAAQPDQIPSIQTHFKRYRDTVRTLFNISLKLHIQAMADA